ncbi:tail fiber assembly protein [Cupriavidus sp. amp6]|uniref:tail fiber assembly protein n=1 Tax=Cupriavidus sp. amp6 TaxID=388051 RepID=UPI00056A31F1|nr:tail fiber assembly protein [Cupriavidus sp. amp6]
MKYEDVKDPIYGSADGTVIFCRVKFDGMRDYVPFGAAAHDCTEHGRRIHAELMGGKYGSIASYAEHLATRQDELDAMARSRRDALLRESDWVMLRSMESGQPVPGEWLAYRQALRDAPMQAGWPMSVVWPMSLEAQSETQGFDQ